MFVPVKCISVDPYCESYVRVLQWNKNLSWGAWLPVIEVVPGLVAQQCVVIIRPLLY